MTVWVIALRSPPFWLKLYRTQKHFLSFTEAAFEGSISGGRGDNWDDMVQPFYFAPSMHEKFEDSTSMVSHTSTLFFLGPGAALLPEHWKQQWALPSNCPLQSQTYLQLLSAVLTPSVSLGQWSPSQISAARRAVSPQKSIPGLKRQDISWEPAKPTGHSPHFLVKCWHFISESRNSCEHMIIYVLCVNQKSIISGSCNLKQHTFSNTY